MKFGLKSTASGYATKLSGEFMLNESLPINLRSINGLSYLGYVYMGKTQKAEVVYDTGSGWLTVTSD